MSTSNDAARALAAELAERAHAGIAAPPEVTETGLLTPVEHAPGTHTFPAWRDGVPLTVQVSTQDCEQALTGLREAMKRAER